jgi:hypothetical protein
MFIWRFVSLHGHQHAVLMTCLLISTTSPILRVPMSSFYSSQICSFWGLRRTWSFRNLDLRFFSSCFGFGTHAFYNAFTFSSFTFFWTYLVRYVSNTVFEIFTKKKKFISVLLEIILKKYFIYFFKIIFNISNTSK